MKSIVSAFGGGSMDTNPVFSPVVRGGRNIQTVRESFGAFAVGPLGGQRFWSAQGGGANPSIAIVAGSLTDGVNSASFVDLGGGPTTPGGTFINLPFVMTADRIQRISYEVRVAAGATQSIDVSPYVGLLAGPMNLMTFVNDAFSVAFHYNAGLVAVELSVYDQVNESGDHFSTGIAANTVFTMHYLLTGNGTFDIYVNDSLVAPGRQMTTGKENILGYYIGTAGVVPSGSIAIGAFAFEYNIG